MCQCFQIGGPFIAEDPDCPIHGTEAQARRRESENLIEKAKSATTVEELRELLIEILNRDT